jgi:CubicO group peptidase (beta-lactamase class C family)
LRNISLSQSQSNDFEIAKKELSKYIRKAMKKKEVIGLSISLVDSQNVIWTAGFGFADEDNRIKATPNTVYRVGSISKLFTAISIMQLYEIGDIDLDEHVNHYIPEFVIKTRFDGQEMITPRTLLTHHSGLPSDIFEGFFSKHPQPFTSIVQLLNKEYTCSPPNYFLSYSNAGFSLLGCIVERVSNQRFVGYTSSKILNPLNMTHSSFELTPDIKNILSKGYVNGTEFDEPALRDVPAGSLYSNVIDLSNFIRMVLNDGKFDGKQIIEKETLHQMMSCQNGNVPLDMSEKIGLSWFIDHNPEEWGYAGGAVMHGGDTHVYHASLIILPKQKFGAVVLTNSQKGNMISYSIARKMLQRILEVRKGITKPEIKKMPPLKSARLTETELLKYTGDYFVGLEYVPVEAKRHKLVITQQNVKILLKPYQQGVFIPQIKLLGFIPISLKNQSIKFITQDNLIYPMTFSATDSSIIGIKFERNEISQSWLKACGKYKNQTPDFNMIQGFELFTEDGLIKVKITIFSGDIIRLTLQTLSDSQAIIGGIGRHSGYTVTLTGDKIRWSGIELQKIRNR